jgi:hypothetical protein
MLNSTQSDPATQAPPRKKAMSERQLAANRANALKSTGPRSPEGKARSRFNSVTHGLTANQVCLPGESRAEYAQRRLEYFEDYRPATLLEADVLDDYVAARWRKDRAIRYEKCLLLDKFMQLRVTIGERYESITPDVEAALAFRELGDESTALKNLDRHETRMIRNIQMAFNQLMELRANRPPAAPDTQPIQPAAENATVQNEPIPENEHPADPEPLAGPEPATDSAETIVIPKRRTGQHTMAAGQTLKNTSLTTSHWPATDHQRLLDNTQLTTGHGLPPHRT